MADWALWGSLVEAGGWRAGPWPGWVTQRRPYPHPPWGSPSHTHQAEERSHCPSFPALPHGARTWELTHSPLPSRPGEEGVAWTPGPRSARQRAKDIMGEVGSLVGGLPPTFGVIVVLLVLGTLILQMEVWRWLWALPSSVSGSGVRAT